MLSTLLVIALHPSKEAKLHTLTLCAICTIGSASPSVLMFVPYSRQWSLMVLLSTPAILPECNCLVGSLIRGL